MKPAPEHSPQAPKTKFYRPHYNGRAAPAGKPRATGGPVIVNAASYEAGISPGALATIFGDNLTTVNDVVLAGSDPVPTKLAGVRVFVSGLPAPIYGVAHAGGEDQISIQVPYEAPTGTGAAEIQVLDYGMIVPDFFTDSVTEDPGIFTYDGNFRDRRGHRLFIDRSEQSRDSWRGSRAICDRAGTARYESSGWLWIANHGAIRHDSGPVPSDAGQRKL